MTRLEVPRDLKARYDEGRLLPFVGAGASMSVSWESEGVGVRGLSWRELVDEAARQLGFDDPDLLRVRGTDLQILEYYRIVNQDRIGPLANWYNRTYHAPDHALCSSPIHVGLSKMSNCSIFYTTNYDDYLERSLRLLGREATPIAIEADIAQAIRDEKTEESGVAHVIKFHGDLNNPGRMVLSERDYEKRLKFSDVEDQRLLADLLGRAMLFIGYSFRDWNVSYLFRMINDLHGELPLAPTGRRAYITVADPSDFEMKLFEGRNIQVVPIDGDHQTEQIAELLEVLAS